MQKLFRIAVLISVAKEKKTKKIQTHKNRRKKGDKTNQINEKAKNKQINKRAKQTNKKGISHSCFLQLYLNFPLSRFTCMHGTITRAGITCKKIFL